VYPIATIGETAAFGAFVGVATAALVDLEEEMNRWMLWGTVLGGFGGIGRVLAGA